MSRTTKPDACDRAAAMAWRRAELERELIGYILRNRRRAIEWAKSAGVTADDFDQPDIRAIFIAIEHTTDRPVIETLRAAKFLLEHDGHFDTAAPRGSRGMHWSYATLAEEACGDPCPGLLGICFLKMKQAVAA
jgi:hypothetical protein